MSILIKYYDEVIKSTGATRGASNSWAGRGQAPAQGASEPLQGVV